MCELSLWRTLSGTGISLESASGTSLYSYIDFVVKANPDIRKCMPFGECSYI